jgi:polysaccharide export outer membrane protein
MPANSVRAFVALVLLALLPAAAISQESTSPRTGGGAFRPGDRIVLTVSDEEALSDTFTVAAGPAVHLPLVGVVSLAGVTRDGLESHLTTAIGRVIRNPIVSAHTLVRLAVLGEVARPGFFALPADALLSDAITMAGGPTANAELRRLTLSRQGTLIQSNEELRRSIAEGRTIDELGISAGDELMVPRRHDGERAARIAGLLVGIPLTILVLTRM